MVKDFISGDTADTIIKDGDFLVDYSDQHHIEDLVRSEKGEYKQHPLTGIGIANYINAPLTRELKTRLEKDIRIQLSADSFEITQVEVENFESIIIDAEINE